MMDNLEYYQQFQENANAKAIIEKIDTSKDRDTNLAILYDSGIKVPAFKDAINVIKTKLAAKYPIQLAKVMSKKVSKKGEIMKQFISFVEHTLPSHCIRCDSDYAPFGQADSAIGDVECMKCRIPAHRECYKSEEIKKDEGIYFVCVTCARIIQREEAAEETVEKQDSDGKGESEEDSDSDHKSASEKAKKVQKKKRIPRKSFVPLVFSSEDEDSCEEDKPKVKKKAQLCPLLVDGNCPHGAAGKGCEYTHKKKCTRYINFGTQEMHKAGCRWGNECKYLHPTLCKNSVSLKICLNEHCQYAHLKNTHNKVGNVDAYNARNQTFPSRTQNYRNANPQRRNENLNSNNSSNSNQSYYSNQRDQNWNRNQPNSGGPNRRPQNSYNRPQYSNSRGSYQYPQEDCSSQNSPFLDQAMERLGQQLLSKLQKQIEVNFEKMAAAYYEANYPSW